MQLPLELKQPDEYVTCYITLMWAFTEQLNGACYSSACAVGVHAVYGPRTTLLHFKKLGLWWVDDTMLLAAFCNEQDKHLIGLGDMHACSV